MKSPSWHFVARANTEGQKSEMQGRGAGIDRDAVAIRYERRKLRLERRNFSTLSELTGLQDLINSLSFQ